MHVAAYTSLSACAHLFISARLCMDTLLSSFYSNTFTVSILSPASLIVFSPSITTLTCYTTAEISYVSYNLSTDLEMELMGMVSWLEMQIR